MRANKDTEEPDVFYIPHNYIDAGSILGGQFKLRNAIEAIAILAAIVVPLFKFINCPVSTKLIISVVVGLPLGILALIGVNDGSLVEFVSDFFNYMFSKKNIVFYSEHQNELEIELKKIQKNKKTSHKKGE